MALLNDALFYISLTLEAVLLARLFRCGMARRLPLFTSLIALYAVRSVLLFGLSGHLEQATYSLGYTALSSLDLLLQVAVAWELFSTAESGTLNVARRFGPALFAAILLVAGGCAWGLSVALPATARAPVDRGVLFTSLLMLAVFIRQQDRFAPTPAARILQGFALLGIGSLLAQFGRVFAAYHRQARDYVRWSYVEPLAYLAVLIFWMVVALRREAVTSPSLRPNFGIPVSTPILKRS